MPGKVDSDKIDATYKDGILKLTLTKAEESLPKKTASSRWSLQKGSMIST
ncbi:MAG: Hsp20/alpha crystallin family protein [Desulfatiglandales bacterium]